MQQPFPELSGEGCCSSFFATNWMKILYSGLATLLVSAACVRSNPAAAPPSEIPQSSSPAVSPASGSWSLIPDEGFHSYASRTVTTLELQGATSAIRDSFAVALDYSLRIQQDTGLPRVTGTIDRLQREPRSRLSETEPAAVLPLSFSGRISSGGLMLDSAGGRAVAIIADCENAGLNQMSVIQRNISSAPLTLRPGTSWTDSSTVSTCSGTVPVELTTVRTYTVIGGAQAPEGAAIVVERSERTRAKGEGTQGQHRIGLQATGTGSARLYLEPASGLLRLAEGKSRTAITIRSSGRLQEFAQTVEERTTRVR
jgi:hypothetical protein